MDGTPRHPERIAAARMAIINHDRIKAELLHFYCTAHWGFDVVAVECNGTDGLAAVVRTKPEFVLVSLVLPDLSAPEIIRQIIALSPASRIIGQATRCTEYLLHQLGGAGYHGLFLDVEEGLVPLGRTIERVRLGIRAVSPGIEQRQTALRVNPAAFPKLLSKREQEVLVCIAHCMSDQEIARSLGISKGTALSHRRRLMDKLDINSTPKLIHYCMEKGFNTATPPGLPSPKDSS